MSGPPHSLREARTDNDTRRNEFRSILTTEDEYHSDDQEVPNPVVDREGDEGDSDANEGSYERSETRERETPANVSESSQGKKNKKNDEDDGGNKSTGDGSSGSGGYFGCDDSQHAGGSGVKTPKKQETEMKQGSGEPTNNPIDTIDLTNTDDDDSCDADEYERLAAYDQMARDAERLNEAGYDSNGEDEYDEIRNAG